MPLSKRCFDTVKVPASPVPPSGEVMISSQINPPPRRKDTTNGACDDSDHVIPAFVLVFSTKQNEGAFTQSRRIVTAKQRREGNVPSVFANFRGRSFDTEDKTDNLRLM
jgi:hypothetical protein